MEITKLNIARMQSQLEHWGAKLQDLAAEAEEAGAEAPNAHHELIAELKSKHGVAVKKLHELSHAGVHQWEMHRASAEHAWHDLEVAIGKLAN